MIYLDNAATTMRKPQEVIDAITAAMCSMGNAGRGVNEASLGAARTVYDTREKLAGFFGAEDARQIVFTMNSTESLNIAIKGILNPGDHVISTVLEHNSVLRPLYEMEKKGVEVTFLGCDEKGTLDYADFEKAIKENTKAIVCTHGSNLTGNKVDVERIGEIAQKHGLLFVVDASQTAGVFPIDVHVRPLLAGVPVCRPIVRHSRKRCRQHWKQEHLTDTELPDWMLRSDIWKKQELIRSVQRNRH